MKETLSPITINSIDWQQINKTSFYTSRGNISSDGNEATVFSRGDLGIVIKTYKDPAVINAQMLAAETLKGLTPEILTFENVKIKIDNRPTTLGRCIVQERVSPLDFLNRGKSTDKDIPKIIDQIKEKIKLDREIFEKNLLIPDPKFINYGVDRQNEIKLIDLGSIITGPLSVDQKLIFAILIRGVSHYFNYLGLQTIFSGGSNIPTKKGYELAKEYQEATGLEFNNEIKAEAFFSSESYLSNLVGLFGGRAFVKIALEEMSKWPNLAVPDSDLIKLALTSKKSDWFIGAKNEIMINRKSN